MFAFTLFTVVDWMAYSGAARFADGAAPLISVGDVLIDDAPAEVVIDGVGLTILWCIDEQSFCVRMEGAEGTRLLASLAPRMTFRDVTALPGVVVEQW